jgi:hypothetical protein
MPLYAPTPDMVREEEGRTRGCVVSGFVEPSKGAWRELDEENCARHVSGLLWSCST